MILFLKNIPASTRYDDIVEFIEPAIKGGLLRQAGDLGRVQMLVIKDNDKNHIEHHGLVNIDPDKIAKKAIEKLNHRLFLGRKIEVREFFYRSWHNDRRLQEQPPNYVLPCERKGDRRRNNLKKLTVNHNKHGKFVYEFF